MHVQANSEEEVNKAGSLIAGQGKQYIHAAPLRAFSNLWEWEPAGQSSEGSLGHAWEMGSNAY